MKIHRHRTVGNESVCVCLNKPMLLDPSRSNGELGYDDFRKTGGWGLVCEEYRYRKMIMKYIGK